MGRFPLWVALPASTHTTQCFPLLSFTLPILVNFISRWPVFLQLHSTNCDLLPTSSSSVLECALIALENCVLTGTYTLMVFSL